MVKLAWDNLLTDAGAEILYLAWVAGAIVEERVIRGVILESKGGRSAVLFNGQLHGEAS